MKQQSLAGQGVFEKYGQKSRVSCFGRNGAGGSLVWAGALVRPHYAKAGNSRQPADDQSNTGTGRRTSRIWPSCRPAGACFRCTTPDGVAAAVRHSGMSNIQQSTVSTPEPGTAGNTNYYLADHLGTTQMELSSGG